MGVWRYTTKVINGVCQRVYKFYEVYGPPEHVVSAGLACVKAGALSAAVALPAYAAVHAIQRARRAAPPAPYAEAAPEGGTPFNAGGFQGFGYTGGRKDDNGGVVYPGFATGAFGSGSGGSYGRNYPYGGSYYRNLLDIVGVDNQFLYRPIAPEGPGREGGGFAPVDLGNTVYSPAPGDQLYSTQPSLADMAPGFGNDFQNTGNTPDTENKVVEPSSLALLGMAILFVSFICKRIK